MIGPSPKRAIDSFTGAYFFPSNFFEIGIDFEGIRYPSVENAYQAGKFPPSERVTLGFTTCSAAEAKRKGKGVKHKYDTLVLMEELVRQKFTKGHLAHRLLDTGDCELIEGNWWHDYFWGVYNGVGQNNLGKILMRVREEIRKGIVK